MVPAQSWVSRVKLRKELLATRTTESFQDVLHKRRELFTNEI